MNLISRRHILLGSAALALLPQMAVAATDLSDILTPPEGGDKFQGKEDAKVTLIEYGSASCPHCARFAVEVLPKLRSEYIDTGKIKFVFREFPHNQLGMAAFMLARCSAPDKFFPLMDVIFSTQPTWMAKPKEGLLNIMKQTGMSEAEFDACLKNQGVADAIEAVREKGASKYGVDSIPTLFLNGQKFKGETTFDDLKKAIDPLL